MAEETSYYDQYMKNRAAMEQERVSLMDAGVPVENMGITGLSSAFDGLQALIRDYKNTDEYKAKVAAKQEERAQNRIRRRGERGMAKDDKKRKKAAKKEAKERGETGKNKRAVNKSLKGFDPNKKNTTSEEAQDAITSGMNPSGPEIYYSPSDGKYASFIPSANYASFMPSANKMKSPMKYGRADATLIAGVRRMNQARNSVNLFQPIDDLVDRVKLMKQQVRSKAEKELNQYSLEKTNDAFSTFKNGTNAATQYLSEQKKIMSDLKAEAERVGVDSPKYAKIKEQIIAVEDRWKKLNTQMVNVQTAKDNWANMHGKGEDEGNNDGRFRYSNAMLDLPEYDYLNQIHSNQADMLINNEGQIEFVVANMNATGETMIVSLDNLENSIYKRDDAGLGAYAKYRQEVEATQKNNLPFNQGKAESLVNQLFGTRQDPNKKNMVSWMYDDLDGDGKTWIDDFTLEHPDFDINTFSPNADWSAMYNEDQTVGEWLRGELKLYYVERLRGLHNNLVQANGKSTMSEYGTGNYDKDYNNKSDAPLSAGERLNKQKLKDQELALKNYQNSFTPGTKIIDIPGRNKAQFRMNANGDYHYYVNNVLATQPVEGKGEQPVVFTYDQAYKYKPLF